MKHIVERIINDAYGKCHEWSYQVFVAMLDSLIDEMENNEIGHRFTKEDQYHNLRFVMNLPLYHEFTIACKTFGRDPVMYSSIPIFLKVDLHNKGDELSPDGIVRLVYEEPEIKTNRDLRLSSVQKAMYEFAGFDRGHGFQRVPHIDHVKFNGPATIIFWKDGTKTVVKHDGKGRKDKRLAILYAFMRKIYGEGKPYHNILNEIEEAIK